MDKPQNSKGDVKKEDDTGGLLYHQLRKLISIVVSIHPLDDSLKFFKF